MPSATPSEAWRGRSSGFCQTQEGERIAQGLFGGAAGVDRMPGDRACAAGDLIDDHFFIRIGRIGSTLAHALEQDAFGRGEPEASERNVEIFCRRVKTERRAF